MHRNGCWPQLVSLSSSDWDDWVPTYPAELMRPEQPWEGSELPVQASLRGETNEPINDLRDPDIFVDVDGQVYLLYVAAGEQSIGVVGLRQQRHSKPLSNVANSAGVSVRGH